MIMDRQQKQLRKDIWAEAKEHVNNREGSGVFSTEYYNHCIHKYLEIFRKMAQAADGQD